MLYPLSYGRSAAAVEPGPLTRVPEPSHRPPRSPEHLERRDDVVHDRRQVGGGVAPDSQHGDVTRTEPSDDASHALGPIRWVAVPLLDVHQPVDSARTT